MRFSTIRDSWHESAARLLRGSGQTAAVWAGWKSGRVRRVESSDRRLQVGGQAEPQPGSQKVSCSTGVECTSQQKRALHEDAAPGAGAEAVAARWSSAL